MVRSLGHWQRQKLTWGQWLTKVTLKRLSVLREWQSSLEVLSAALTSLLAVPKVCSVVLVAPVA